MSGGEGEECTDDFRLPPLVGVGTGTIPHIQTMDANARVSAAQHCDLAYFLQESGMCEAYCRWYDECPPLQRLLRAKGEAREVWDMLQEGKKRRYESSVVAESLDAMMRGTGSPVEDVDGGAGEASAATLSHSTAECK